MAETKKLTLEELRAKTAKAIKEATTFEKSPTFEMPLGTEIVFRVKKVVEGNFDAPIVIASELRVGNVLAIAEDPKSTKFLNTALKAYTQDGKDGPKVFTEVKPGEEIRVPTFVVKRAGTKKLEFHPSQVYWAHYREDVKVERGTFKVTAVDLVGTEFPEA